MLLRLGIENFLSLRDSQAISLIPSALADDQKGLIRCPAAGGPLLPAAVIYGANASGKSNVVRALSFLRSAVLLSHSRGDQDTQIPREPFALDQKSAELPTRIDIDFVLEGIRYHYGFAATDKEFVEEWLTSFPTGRPQRLFKRENGRFTFSRKLKGRNKIISELTRANSLFLSAATQNDHEELSKISRYIGSLRTNDTIAIQKGTLAARFSDAEPDQRVIDFLRRVGTGVTDYRKEQRPLSDQTIALHRDIQQLFHKYVKDSLKDFDKSTEVEFQLGHRGWDGKSVYLDLDRESAGTRRLLVLLSHSFRALDDGTLLVIDELDASLHTQACEGIVALFCTPATNLKGAQLIATTHDTNLLRSKYLRRDQIWFTEKDEEGATSLYPLSDIRTRKGDNIEKGYLQGRFGAVPYSGPIDDMIS
jgi:uncharacterized protein